MTDWESFYRGLYDSANSVVWDITGLARGNRETMELPAKSTFVTAVIEEITVKALIEHLDGLGVTCERGGDREYPDLTLLGGVLANSIVALDVKTCRKVGQNRVSGFTLGSRAGYFRNPDNRVAGCRRPYGEFSKHVVVGLVYEWRPRQRGTAMVQITDRVVAEKWQLASRSTGTGTTHHIGSVKELDRLLEKRGMFASEDEFEEYWRNYGQ